MPFIFVLKKEKALSYHIFINISNLYLNSVLLEGQ